MATIRTRKRGRTYSYIFEAGQVNGKRKTVKKGGFKTKEAAYNAGVEAYADSSMATLVLSATIYNTKGLYG